MNIASDTESCAHQYASGRTSRFTGSLADRVDRLCSAADVSATVHIAAANEGLPPCIRQVVAEVVDEAVMSATGADEGRACVVAVWLEIGAGSATLTVRDDGAALLHRDVFGSRPGRIGVAGIRRRVEDVGGELTLRRLHPRGVELIGRLPFDAADDSQ